MRKRYALLSALIIGSFSPLIAEESSAPATTEVVEVVEEGVELQDQKNLTFYVNMETNFGPIILELDASRAPNTVGNFIEYLNESYYDGLIFHRVIDGFMVQGGGFDESLTQKKSRIPVNIESDNGLKNDRGSIAMARSADPNSATSQFFINLVDNDFLNYPAHDGYGYTVFGRVISGMEVVDKMAKVPVEPKGAHQHMPTEVIKIERATLIEAPSGGE